MVPRLRWRKHNGAPCEVAHNNIHHLYFLLISIPVKKHSNITLSNCVFCLKVEVVTN